MLVEKITWGHKEDFIPYATIKLKNSEYELSEEEYLKLLDFLEEMCDDEENDD